MSLIPCFLSSFSLSDAKKRGHIMETNQTKTNRTKLIDSYFFNGLIWSIFFLIFFFTGLVSDFRFFKP